MMHQKRLFALKRLGFLTAALILAFGLFISSVTTSYAEPDYHWLSTFSDYFDSAGGTVTAFDFAPSGNLYVGGDFTSAGRDGNGDLQIVNGLAMWDGEDWHPLGGGFGLQFGGLLPSVGKVIALSDDDVYIAGFFAYILNSVDGVCPQDCIAVRGIAHWDGTSWSGLGPANAMGVSGPSYAAVSDMEFYNGELWITGLFENAGTTTAHGIAKWTAGAWEYVDGGDDHGMAGNGSGNALATDGAALYIGGGFDKIGNIPAANIAKYTEDHGFEAMGAGLPGVNVTDIVVVGNDVYAAGNSNSVDQPGGLWRFDGMSWSVVGNGVWANFYNTTPGQVAKLFLDGDDLYVGGLFGRVGTDTLAANLAIWNITNQEWSQFGNPLYGQPYTGVFAIDKKGSQIFVGGLFSQIGGRYIQDGEDFSYQQGIQSISMGIYDPNALPPPAEANLSVNLDLSDSILDAGDELDVCVSVSNFGEDTATNVTLTTAVPAGAVLASPVTDECNSGGGGGEAREFKRVSGAAFPLLSPDCTTPNTGEVGAIICNIGTLDDSDSVQIHFTVQFTAAPGSEIEFTASVSGTELDPNLNNNARAETVRLRPNVVYVSANQDCGGNTPCYANTGEAFGELARGGTLNLLPGEYYGSIYLYDNNTVNVTGNVILNGRLALYEGTFNAPAGTLELRSSLENDGGTFHHNNGTVYLNQDYYQEVRGDFQFYNLIIGANTIVDTGEMTLDVAGTLTNNGTIYHSPAGQYVANNTPTTFNDGVNHPAVTLTSTGANELGDTYVYISMSEEPPACGSDPFPALAVLRHFDILPSAYEDIHATLRLYYDASELNGVDPATVGIYHCGYDPETDTLVWDLLTSARGPNGSYYVETENVTSFSPFALGGSAAAPTSEILASAKAKRHKQGGVTIKWQTGTEMEVVGFKVLRSKKADGKYKVVKNEMKAAKHPGQPIGDKYNLRDKHAKPGKQYFYKVQVFKADGGSEMSDPIRVKVK